MAVIDSDNFITHLVWSGLVDKATCGELKRAIELCTVKDIYTKDDMVAMLTELQLEIEELYPEHQCTGELTGFAEAIETITPIIQQKINALRGEENDIYRS